MPTVLRAEPVTANRFEYRYVIYQPIDADRQEDEAYLFTIREQMIQRAEGENEAKFESGAWSVEETSEPMPAHMHLMLRLACYGHESH